uniref:Histidine-containing phosphotransfer protein n=1 Tax=Leersia perrieri TaxID=77586 RepID=A0A0D9V5J0_9ORYZ
MLLGKTWISFEPHFQISILEDKDCLAGVLSQPENSLNPETLKLSLKNRAFISVMIVTPPPSSPPPGTIVASPSPLAGYLDEQFCQVEDLQDEASPNFVEEVVTLFFKDSGRLMSNIEQALIGASRMKNECMSFRDSCGQGNVEGCMRSFQKVKREHAILRQKLESYFQLLRQAGPAGAATRPVM